MKKQKPYNLDAERAVIGSMLVDSRCIVDVIGIIRSEHFYSELNRNIFDTIFSMFCFGKAIDGVTVAEQMREDGTYTDSTPAAIHDMMTTSAAANVVEYASIVRDKALLRELIDTVHSITELAISGKGGAAKILDTAVQKILKLSSCSNGAELEDVSRTVPDVYKHISDIAKSGGGIPGLSTGFTALDKLIMGLNKSDLILILSEPGVGKTSIALNIAFHVARKSGLTVAMFSLGMPREQLVSRLLSSQSNIGIEQLRTGRIGNAYEWNSLTHAAEQISQAKLKINDNAFLTMTDIAAQCRCIEELGMVVIDNMPLVSAAVNERGGGCEINSKMTATISRTMKTMAKDLGVPVICLSQLSDLHKSGFVAQDVDIIMRLCRDGFFGEESESPDRAELFMLKNHRGKAGVVNLKFDPLIMSFTDTSTDI